MEKAPGRKAYDRVAKKLWHAESVEELDPDLVEEARTWAKASRKKWPPHPTPPPPPREKKWSWSRV